MGHSVMFLPCKLKGLGLDLNHLSDKVAWPGSASVTFALEMWRHMDA